MVWVHNNTSTPTGQPYSAGMNSDWSRTGQNHASDASRVMSAAALRLMRFSAETLATKMRAYMQSGQCTSPTVQSVMRHVHVQLAQFDSYLSAGLMRLGGQFGCFSPTPGSRNAHGSAQQPPRGWTTYNGVHYRRVFDQRRQVAWNESYNPSTGQHVSVTAWRPADSSGMQSRLMFNHQNGMLWTEHFHPTSRHHMSYASVTGQDGTRWHTTFDHATGRHTSVTDWWSVPNGGGMLWRKVYDHNTGHMAYQHHAPHGTSGAHAGGAGQNARGMTKEKANKVLGIRGDAPYEEAKKAYRKLARELHSDVNDDPRAHERFKEITEAWDFLDAMNNAAKAQT